MPPSTTVKLPPQLVRQLRTFRRRLRTVKMLEAVCLAGIAVILSYALLYLSDRLWETPPAVGWLLFFIAVSGLAVFIPWWSFRWVWQRRKEAQLDKRSVPVALRHCARAIAPRAANKSLRATLDGISTSPFPETGLRMLKSCLEKMENKLEKEMRGKLIERADLEELARISEES